MDIKSIIKHVIKKGPIKTYQIYKKRKKEKEKELRKIRLENDVVEKIAKGSFEDAREAFREYLKMNSPQKGITEKFYNKYLRSIYIKKVYPKVYQTAAARPVENKVIFMEREGAHYLSWKYMYDYLKNNSSYELKVHYLGLRDVSNEQYYENAKEYLRDAATAKAVFVCSADDLMGYLTLRKETTYIQLWHGCGVFKKVGLSTIDKKFGKSAASHKEYPINTNYSYVTIASPELSWIFEESMNIKKESGIIKPVGVSRTDIFFDPSYIKNCYEKLYKKIPESKNKKVLLYAPTFRGRIATASAPDKLDIEKFAEDLGDEYILICKHHQLVKQTPTIPEKYKNTFAFDLSNDPDMNINDLMIVSDICISDYSSVVFEYSLMERPMIFFVYDLEEYIDERGLYYNLDEITPGPLFKTNDEIIDYIQHIEENFDKQVVIDFKNRFMCCCDGHSSERIASLI